MRKLPVLQDLYNDKALAIKSDDLNVLLNAEPKKEWLKDHPMAKNVKYIPIERVEYLLTALFQKWYVEIRDAKLIANSVVVTVRLHYQNPITGEMIYQDGIGANPLQTNKNAGATDWTQIKSDAVMKAAPAAESYAIKDAAEKIGKIFGKDMNRADKIMYDTLSGRFDDPNATQDLIIRLKEFENYDELSKKQVEITREFEDRGVSKAKDMVLKRLEELK